MLIVLYCLGIVLCSLLGGFLPLSRRVSHLKLQVYLSLSAGAMLGAAFFHMLPECAELAGRQFGFWMAVGVIGLYMIERFLSPHSHDTSEVHTEARAQAHAHDHEHGHEHDDETAHGHANPPERESKPAAPLVAGWSAVVGLTIHTLIGGFALGGAVLGQDTPKGLGMAVFLATILHKPADALTISTLLVKGAVSQRVILGVQCFFASLIPMGVLLFYFGKTILAGHLDTAFTGCVLAFSAGTFLCIALSDLLPEVQFHSHDRAKLFFAVLVGAGIMWLTAFVEPGHSHRSSPEPHAPETHSALVLPNLRAL